MISEAKNNEAEAETQTPSFVMNKDGLEFEKGGRLNFELKLRRVLTKKQTFREDSEQV